MTSGRDASNTSDHDGSCAVMTNEAFVVETRDLTKRYSDRIVAVDHLNLRVRQGGGLRVPRPQRRRQDDDAAHAARVGPPGLGQRWPEKPGG